MNESKYVLKQFPEAGYKGKFLALGEWPELVEDLLEAGWTGVVVDHKAAELATITLPTPATYEHILYVHGPIDMAPHYIDVDRCYKMRAVTFREILDNFQGPFNLIIVSAPGLGKDLSCSAEMWNAWPRVICVRSEGREQEIMNITAQHSYEPVRMERDALILARPEEDVKK